MALTRIDLTDFRNHAQTTLDQAGRFNLLVGENGAGKTNVLEALSLFAPGRGMRRAPLDQMTRQGGGQTFSIGADCLPGPEDRGASPVRLGTYVEAERPSRRQVRINGSAASAVSMGEWLAIGWLTPAMDGLFTAAASVRRHYLDRLAVAIDPAHARASNRYANALRERNKLLSEDRPADPAWLDGIEQQMAEWGSRLAQGRQSLVSQLQGELAKCPVEPFARPALTYEAGGPLDRDQLAQALHDNRGADRIARRTLIGPQRDDLSIMLPSKQAEAARCSTGEQKAILIAMTLAHAALAAKGRASVLLLDEVAAHLDALRRAALFDRLRAAGNQVWMTGTDTTVFTGILPEATVWNINAGSALPRV